MFSSWKSGFRSLQSTDYQGLVTQDEFASSNNNPLYYKKSELVIYWVYFIYGVAMLLPWNVFITASEYFSYRFSRSAHEKDFQNYFSAYSNCTNLIALAVLLWLRQRKLISSPNVLIPLTVNMLVFLFYTITSVWTSISADAYFTITILSMVATAISTSFLQLTVLADASLLSPKYIQSVMSGQGIAGVSVSLFSFITTIFGGDGRSVFSYFFSAFLVTLVAVIGKFVLQHNSSYQRMIRPSTPSINMDIALTEDSGHNAHTMWDIVFKTSSGYIFTVIYIYVITLALFPSLTVQIQSVNQVTPSVFISLHFLLFNIGDWLGRTLPIFKLCQITSGHVLLGLTLLRTLFIPIFLHLLVKSDDLLFFISVLLLAISNGWLTSLVFMAAPLPYSQPNTKSMAGSIMSFSLVIGLALGGLSSFFVLT